MTRAPGDDETVDSLCGVAFLQPRHGYRVTLDAVLLAGFTDSVGQTPASADVVELGAGSGIVSLLLASWNPGWRFSAVEVQPRMASVARRNARKNALPIEVVESDWRSLPLAMKADLVVSNPPYFPATSARQPPDPTQAASRYEHHGNLESLARSAASLLKPDGAVRLIHSAGRAGDVFKAFRTVQLMPTVLRFVHPRANEPAHTMLVEFRPHSRRALVVEPPLIVHEAEGGGYSAEVSLLLSRRPVPCSPGVNAGSLE